MIRHCAYSPASTWLRSKSAAEPPRRLLRRREWALATQRRTSNRAESPVGNRDRPFRSLNGSQKLAKIAKISKIAKPSAHPSHARFTTSPGEQFWGSRFQTEPTHHVRRERPRTAQRRIRPMSARIALRTAAEERNPNLPLPWRSWKSWRSWRPSGSDDGCPRTRNLGIAAGVCCSGRMRRGQSALRGAMRDSERPFGSDLAGRVRLRV